ncbi:MAG: hypothetical protein M5R40_00835 [Anaerolineae bacterium]|nr:hypothetical protein [Anaerolineae bacterium]
MVHGLFSPPTTMTASCSKCSRVIGGSSVRLGTPRSNRLAPSHSGRMSGSDIAPATSANSSSETMEICRSLRISVPRG